MAASKRGRQTVRDMVLSMAAIGVVVAGIYVFVPHSTKDPVHEIRYATELRTARRAAPYPLLAPEGLPKGWRATSVTYDGGNPKDARWHLGFIDPQDEYAAVEQSNGPARPFIDSVSQGAQHDGAADVRGETWQRFDGAKYNALVRQGKGYTVVVTGTAPYGQLAELAAALRPS